LDVSDFPVAEPLPITDDGFHRRDAEFTERFFLFSLGVLRASAVKDPFLRALRVLRGEYSFAVKPEQPFI
jgi:hypothetical protein